MSLTIVILGVATTIILLEMIVYLLVAFIRKHCKWLITKEDLHPYISQEGLEKFIKHGFDRDLGWIRKPNTAHDEVTESGNVSRYHIGNDGARVNPSFMDRDPEILLYGDSYAFARQVNDNETWSHHLSLALDLNISNRGVGNYGVDQATLRLEREFDANPTPLVIMAFVPETIARIQSVWKHFGEYGNTFAFKPRFHLESSALRLQANPISDLDDFRRIDTFLGELQRSDGLYRRKFAKDVLGFPYLWHVWKTRHRSFPLIAAAIQDLREGQNGHAFSEVMRQNIEFSAQLYQDKAATDLLRSVLLRFSEFVRQRGSMPLIVFLPQLMDLQRIQVKGAHYGDFVNDLNEHVTTVDLSATLLEEKDLSSLFVEDRYGGHYSTKGNQVVANRLVGTCHDLLRKKP